MANSSPELPTQTDAKLRLYNFEKDFFIGKNSKPTPAGEYYALHDRNWSRFVLPQWMIFDPKDKRFLGATTVKPKISDLDPRIFKVQETPELRRTDIPLCDQLLEVVGLTVGETVVLPPQLPRSGGGETEVTPLQLTQPNPHRPALPPSQPAMQVVPSSITDTPTSVPSRASSATPSTSAPTIPTWLHVFPEPITAAVVDLDSGIVRNGSLGEGVTHAIFQTRSQRNKDTYHIATVQPQTPQSYKLTRVEHVEGIDKAIEKAKLKYAPKRAQFGRGERARTLQKRRF